MVEKTIIKCIDKNEKNKRKKVISEEISEIFEPLRNIYYS